MAWALIGGPLLLWFAWSGPVIWIYAAVLIALLIVQGIVEPGPKPLWFLNINGPEDLDRPGGPYDHLRRKPQKAAR